MTLRSTDMAAGRDLAVGLAPFVVGVILVALLIALVWRGQRGRARAPRPEEQPRLPESGPVGEIIERRRPNSVPRDGTRWTPHRLPGFGHLGTRRARDRRDPSAPDRDSRGQADE
ncbi:DUF6479 family protein [Streptomyces melanogenes]|uniref:DUF6479 family protein n=1 Tax=Streptomyces melanogenes TaxID=67326 RepID=UPI0037922A04